MVLAIYHVFYINLLINMRFKCKIKCVTVGKCVFDVTNYAFCYCFLRSFCRDRCFKWPTLLKWGIKAPLFAYLWFAVRAIKDEALNSENAVESVPVYALSYYDTFLLIYVLQHPIFMAARLPFFILYSLLTCCCDKGREFSEREMFDDRIISFEFIDRELEEHDNFANHAVGRDEVEFNRNLAVVRDRRMSLQNSIVAQQELGTSSVQRMRGSIKRTILTKLSMSQQGICPICTCDFQPGEKVDRLGCHRNHMLHHDCYVDYDKFLVDKGNTVLCPVCRRPVNKEEITKIEIEKNEDVANDNPFALDGIGSDVKPMNDENALKNASADANNPTISVPIQGSEP